MPSRERRKRHKEEIIGEQKGYLPDAMDYSNIGKNKDRKQRRLTGMKW